MCREAALKRDQRAFTLLEVTVSCGVLSLALLLALQSAMLANHCASSETKAGTVRLMLNHAFARLSEELSDAALDTVVLADPALAVSITFQRVTGYDKTAGVRQCGTPITLCLEPGQTRQLPSGPVPTGRIVRVQDGLKTVVAENIVAHGFEIALNGRVVVFVIRPFSTVAEDGSDTWAVYEFKQAISIGN